MTPVTEQKKSKFYWLPDAMPKVAAEIAVRRKALGAEHVNESLVRGMRGEPGWFFAIEGPMMVGTPDPALRSIDRVYEVLSSGLPVDWVLELKQKGVDYGKD